MTTSTYNSFVRRTAFHFF